LLKKIASYAAPRARKRHISRPIEQRTTSPSARNSVDFLGDEAPHAASPPSAAPAAPNATDARTSVPANLRDTFGGTVPKAPPQSNAKETLHTACKRGLYDVVKEKLKTDRHLIDGGDSEGFAPLHLAAANCPVTLTVRGTHTKPARS
jgi:ankyrin repeat protein